MKLVLGIGNEILTDDGIGPRLVNDLSKNCLNQNVHFACACVGGLEIIELLNGYDEAILIDAIRTKNGTPGSVYLFSPDDFRETMHLSNLHDISFLTALRLGKKLNIKLPEEIRIIAVEIIEDREFSNELTPPLNSRYPEILKEIKDYLITEQVFDNSV
ncbi:MAG: hydrogenase maturation protease [Porphyromonadaceae bacterium]|nr:MAG: hydrogenase maturation protease [Porphyromonadaceae bacterium]